MAMPTEIPVLVQTTYAELTERAHLARLQSDFDPAGTFLKKERRGRNYWYFRSSMAPTARNCTSASGGMPSRRTAIASAVPWSQACFTLA
jgi:hypothetical protein